MAISIRTILCAIDFSQFSKQVIDCGAAFARRFNARMIVFNALHLPQDAMVETPAELGHDSPESRESLTQERIERLMTGYAVEWEPLVSFGDPADMAVKLAETRNADLVIAASYGLSGFKRLLIGTVIERMARSLTRPFLVVHPRKGQPFDAAEPRSAFSRILAGCTPTPESEPLIEYVRAFADSWGARLHLLHSLESPYHEAFTNFQDGPYTQIQRHLTREVQQQMKTLVKEPSDQVHIAIATGNPGEALMRYARQHGIDLIAVGVRFHKPLEKMIIGSTTEAVLRHAPCTVLVVPSTIGVTQGTA